MAAHLFPNVPWVTAGQFMQVFIYTSRLLPGIKEPNRRHKRHNLISVIRMDLYRYRNQKALPIRLQKGKYYYMETRMKDDHQDDHLEVGMQAPDGTNYTVIPSAFLRTSLPVPPRKSVTMNFFDTVNLARLVQTLDSGIHRIIHYPADKYKGN